MAGDSEQSLPGQGHSGGGGPPFLIGVSGGTASGKVRGCAPGGRAGFLGEARLPLCPTQLLAGGAGKNRLGSLPRVAGTGEGDSCLGAHLPPSLLAHARQLLPGAPRRPKGSEATWQPCAAASGRSGRTPAAEKSLAGGEAPVGERVGVWPDALAAPGLGDRVLARGRMPTTGMAGVWWREEARRVYGAQLSEGWNDFFFLNSFINFAPAEK